MIFNGELNEGDALPSCEIENTFDSILDKAAVANISHEEILNVLQLLFQERENSKDE